MRLFVYYLFFICVRVAGVDMWGRTVVVVVGRNIPVTLLDLEKVAPTFTTFI